VSEWYALSTEPRRERVAAAGLAERYIPVFLPMETEWAQERGKVINVPALTPLFPGYVFALLERYQMPEALEVEGVSAFVRLIDETGEQRPFAIPASVILALQVEERAGGFDRRLGPVKPPPYKPKKGDRVLIVAGPYLALIGMVLRPTTKTRAKIRLEDGREPELKVSHLKPALAA
jgi:transcription antitermination factor NusG